MQTDDYKTYYQIFATQGQGECYCDRFDSLAVAERYIRVHEGEASFRIETAKVFQG